MSTFYNSRKFLKLWIGIYIILYVFPFPLRYIPFSYELFSQYYFKVLESIVLLFGKNILGWEDLIKIQNTGSGDTSFDYASLLVIFLISLFISVAIFLLRSKKSEFTTFYQWSLLYARYFVGLTLISYGIAKFWNGQFDGPSIGTMEVMYGNMTPMGLAWRFLGYSDTYKFFMGISEITAGFLLVFRRTKVLGALLSIAVCTNIVLVNFSFDVPVKLLSSHLLLFSIFVILSAAKAIFDFFILHKNSHLTGFEPQFSSRKMRLFWLAINIYLVGIVPLNSMGLHIYHQLNYTEKHPWIGMYMDLDAREKPAFEKLIVEENFVSLVDSAGNHQYLSVKEVTETGSLLLSNSADSENPHELQFRNSDNDKIILNLRMEEKVSQFKATRKEKSSYPITKRGFHWVNEYPFNR